MILDLPWRCCDHCDHLEPDYDPATWGHEDPCPHGCNDEEG